MNTAATRRNTRRLVATGGLDGHRIHLFGEGDDALFGPQSPLEAPTDFIRATVHHDE